jgi:hypothetical protein
MKYISLVFVLVGVTAVACKRSGPEAGGTTATTPVNLANVTEPKPASCEACEAQAWTARKTKMCSPEVAGCSGLPGDSKAACEGLVACVRRTGCARDTDGDMQPCYCGDGVNDEDCLGGKASGACKTEVEAAAQSTVALTVAARFAVTAFPVSRAAHLFRCDAAACKGICKY